MVMQSVLIEKSDVGQKFIGQSFWICLDSFRYSEKGCLWNCCINLFVENGIVVEK